MFADIMYYSYFNSLPSIRMIKQFHQLGAVGDSIKALLNLKNLLFILDIPFLIIYLKKSGEPKTYNKYIRYGAPAAIALFFAILLFVLNANDLIVAVSNQELYSYHYKDIKDAIFEDGIEIVEGRGIFTGEDLEELKTRTKLEEGKYTGVGKGKNLIVIQVEALQSFVINHFYENQEITPNLNRLVKGNGSIYFDNYYQQIGRGNTSDAEFVTNNSLYPSMEEPTYTQYEENTFYGLPWILRDNGYTSWVFHGYEKEFWNREKAYVNQGFQRFISEEDFDVKESIGFGITDEEFYKQSMDYLKELDSKDDNPFHAFIITLTSHTPFNMPEEYQYLNIKEEHEGTIFGDYIQSIHYADKALGQFIDSLKEEGLYDNSVIALYGDHFAITGFNPLGVELMTELLDTTYDINDMFNVPLIIHVPGEEFNETISKIGSQLDFLPTILNIMGYENEKGLMFGRDLINYDGENFVAAQTYVIKGSFIDNNTLFYMSVDGIYGNSKAMDRKTRKVLDVESFKERYEYIISEINKSDYILKKDLLKYFIENEGEVDLAQLSGTGIPNDEYIVKCYRDPLESLERNYKDGKRLLAIDLQWFKDGEIVLKDNRNDKKVHSKIENLRTNEKGELDPKFREVKQTIEDLAEWMKNHEDAYIVLRSSEEDESIFLKIKDDYKELRDRFIVEMTKFEQYIKLSNKAYKNIMINLSKGKYDEKEIVDFLKRNPLTGVILDKELVSNPLFKKLQKLNIPIYVDGMNNIIDIEKLQNKNIRGFFIEDEI